MKLNLIDQLTLLSLDDESGAFITDSMSYAYSIAGAVLLELSLHNRIEIIHKNKVLVKDKLSTGDQLLDDSLQQIVDSKKERSIQHWIETFGDKVESIKKQTIEKLIQHKIIVHKKEKVLWLFTVNKYPALNSDLEDNLKKLLHTIIEKNLTPELNEVMILSLIDTCQLHKEVFGKEKAKAYEKKIKELIKGVEISQIMNQTVREVHNALQAALILLITSTLITTTVTTN